MLEGAVWLLEVFIQGRNRSWSKQQSIDAEQQPCCFCCGPTSLLLRQKVLATWYTTASISMVRRCHYMLVWLLSGIGGPYILDVNRHRSFWCCLYRNFVINPEGFLVYVRIFCNKSICDKKKNSTLCAPFTCAIVYYLSFNFMFVDLAM